MAKSPSDRYKPRGHFGINTSRAPVIGDPLMRTRKTELLLTPDEMEAVDMLWPKRRCLSRSDYLRFLIEQDYAGSLLIVDDAFLTFAEAIGRGIGGAAAELTAQADAYRLHKGLSGV